MDAVGCERRQITLGPGHDNRSRTTRREHRNGAGPTAQSCGDREPGQYAGRRIRHESRKERRRRHGGAASEGHRCLAIARAPRSIELRRKLRLARRRSRPVHARRYSRRVVARLVATGAHGSLSSRRYSRHSNRQIRQSDAITRHCCSADALTASWPSALRGTGGEKVVYEGTGFELRHPLKGNGPRWLNSSRSVFRRISIEE